MYDRSPRIKKDGSGLRRTLSRQMGVTGDEWSALSLMR